MGRRTDPQILVDHLRDQPRNSASPTRLSALTGWPADKVERAIQRGRTPPALHIGRGGLSVSRRGSSARPDLQRRRKNSRVTGPRELGLGDVAFGTVVDGAPGHPDLVVSADPRRRRSLSNRRDFTSRLTKIRSRRLPGTRPGRRKHCGSGASLQVTDYEWIGPDCEELGVGIEFADRRLEHGGPIFTQSSRLPRENSGASSLRSRCARTSRLS